MTTRGLGALSHRVDRVYLDGSLDTAATDAGQDFAFATFDFGASVQGVTATAAFVAPVGVASASASADGFGTLSHRTSRACIDGSLGSAATQAGQWLAFPPSTELDASITATPLAASSAMQATASGGANVTSVPLAGSSTMPVSALSGSASITGSIATSSVTAFAGSESGTGKVSGVAATITVIAYSGTASGSSEITGVVAVVSAVAYPGSASAGGSNGQVNGVSAEVSALALVGSINTSAIVHGVTALVTVIVLPGTAGSTPTSPVDYSVALQNMIRQGYMDAEILAYLYENQDMVVADQLGRLAPVPASGETSAPDPNRAYSGYWYNGPNAQVE